jgi:hypothetical protein
MGYSNVLVGTEAERVVIGLPLHAFALQYLFHSTVYPLGRMAMLIGESNTCKTAALHEIGRWHLNKSQGAYTYLLNEPRDSPDYRSSIIWDPEAESKRCQLLKCASMEEWQDHCSGWVTRFEESFKATGDVTFPMLLGLDSITGTTSQANINKMKEAGHAIANFPVDANLINMYMKWFPNRISAWPISFVTTSHVKFGVDQFGNKQMRIPGGDALRYYSTYILLFKRGHGAQLQGRRRLEITSFKSSLGEDAQKLTVDLIWWYEENGKQHTVWDWHSATVDLLTSFPAQKQKAIDEIIYFDQVNATGSVVCKQLGFSKPTPKDEVGHAISLDAGLMKALREHFGIHERQVFQDNVSYAEQIRQAIKSGHLETIENRDVVDPEYKVVDDTQEGL